MRLTQTVKTIGASVAASAAILAMPIMASALTVSCIGTPATASITWVASSANASGTVAYLWSNSGTTSTQTINYIPGTYSISVKATDASSTVATSTCSATVAAPATTTPPAGVSAQIAALLAQINALKAQILALVTAQQGTGGTGTTTPPVLNPGLGKVCDRIETDLSRGHRGGDVEKLQRFLANQGFMASSTVTGAFGPMTEKALKQFQKNNGLVGTGFFGESTRKFFEKHCEDRDDHGGMRPMASSTVSSTTKPSINLGGRGRENEQGENHGRNGRDD